VHQEIVVEPNSRGATSRASAGPRSGEFELRANHEIRCDAMNTEGFFHLLAARDDRILDRLWQQQLVVAARGPPPTNVSQES
jgi:hypothetical protein